MSSRTSSVTKKWLEKHGHWAHFVPRSQMARKRPMAKATLPAAEKSVPPTTLPVDNTGSATVSCPMLGNDQYGDCGPVMMAHMAMIRSFGQGKPGFTEINVNQAALVSQYEKVSGGDNGTDEDMLVGTSGIATPAGGGVAGDPTDIVDDHLDVDLTDVPLVQHCHDFYYGVHMAWSVPDVVLKSFAQGEVFASPGVPDPNNGHYTPLSDVGGPSSVAADGTNVNGFYRLWTWGAWCWVSPAFVASVQPQGFATFSRMQFNKAGYDSHGRHVSDVAAAWISIGGNASLVSPVVALFPAKVAPPAPPPPPPATSGWSQTNAQAWAAAGIAEAPDALETKGQAVAAACAGLVKYGPPS